MYSRLCWSRGQGADGEVKKFDESILCGMACALDAGRVPDVHDVDSGSAARVTPTESYSLVTSENMRRYLPCPGSFRKRCPGAEAM